MMISPAGANDPYAAAAALDRQLRSSSSDSGDSSSDATASDSGPDVVVTLSQGTSSAPSTYDASGRMSRSPTLDDMGANAPDSMAKARESDGDDDDASSTDATSAATAPAASSDDDGSSADASVDEDAAVAA